MHRRRGTGHLNCDRSSVTVGQVPGAVRDGRHLHSERRADCRLAEEFHERWQSAIFKLIVARTLEVLGAELEVEPGGRENASQSSLPLPACWMPLQTYLTRARTASQWASGGIWKRCCSGSSAYSSSPPDSSRAPAFSSS
jgi:hypothetical protein